MNLTEHAQEHQRRNGLRAKTVIKNCKRFEKLTGSGPPDHITSDRLAAFREQCLAAGLSHATIEKTVTDVATIFKVATGKPLDVGRRLKQKRPQPTPVPLDTIDATFRVSPRWLQRWMVLVYWTAARAEDSLRLFASTRKPGEVLRLQASKTGHQHVWPSPDWLKEWMQWLPSPVNGSTLHYTNVLRRSIRTACLAASVQIWHPQQLRQRSITEWSRANATAGAIVHGCGLGVLAHYVDPLSVLESAAPCVRVPAAMLGTWQGAPEDSLLSAWRRCDPAARELVRATAERMAAG